MRCFCCSPKQKNWLNVSKVEKKKGSFGKAYPSCPGINSSSTWLWKWTQKAESSWLQGLIPSAVTKQLCFLQNSAARGNHLFCLNDQGYRSSRGFFTAEHVSMELDRQSPMPECPISKSLSRKCPTWLSQLH